MGHRVCSEIVLNQPPSGGFFLKDSMFATIKKLLKKPSAEVLAMESLEEARRCYLTSKASAEYHGKMAEYYLAVEDRLTKYLASKR